MEKYSTKKKLKGDKNENGGDKEEKAQKPAQIRSL